MRMKMEGKNIPAAPEKGPPVSGLEQSRKNYERAADLIRDIAENIVELSIPDTTLESWRSLLSAIRTVDDKIDHVNDNRERNELAAAVKKSLRENVADFPDKELEAAMRQVNDLGATLDQEQRAFFHRMLLLILDITEDIKNEEDPKKMTSLTLLEGQMTAKLFLPFLPKTFRDSDRYPKLIHALARLGRAGNGFDTAVDLPIDHRNGQVRVRSTIRNRLLLLGGVLVNGKDLIKDLKLSRELAGKILRFSGDTMQGASEKDRDLGSSAG